MREFSVPPVVAVPDCANLTDLVWDNAAQTPDTAQFARRAGGSGWRDVTCAEFRDEVVALARGLVAAGVEPGGRVALMSKTRYEWSLVDFAIWACGAVTVPIYETSSAEQVEWILSDSGATACVVETGAHAAVVDRVRATLPGLRRVFQLDKGLDELVAAGAAVEPDRIEVLRHTAGADDLATVIYTSGTTGRPKGCMLTHRNMYANATAAVTALQALFYPGASTLLFLPLAHSFARLVQNGVVYARVQLGHSPDVHNLVADLQEFRPTFVLAVPRVFEKVYNAAKQRAHTNGRGRIFDWAAATAIAYSKALDSPAGPGLGLRLRHRLGDRLVYGRLRAALGGRCEAAISGGAPLGERLAHFFRGVGVTILEGYGLTETAPAVASNQPGANRLGTVGRPLPGVSVRIDDSGEILVKGDLVFRGYWNDPQATAEILGDDGWLHTGDLGDLDDDGHLRITGRKKEIIVTAGGKNIAPAVLEDRMRTHPLVSQCVVVGDRQPFVAALVTIDEETWPGWLADSGHPATATVAELRDDPRLRAEIQLAVDEANRAVSQAEAIKMFRILPRDFTEATGELTPSMKVKRNVVQKEYADEIAKIYLDQ